ncbi:TonB-dependent receptor [Catalinimonas sp. 4WD22]|uniref:SusC/RagA family TonB-linked outer membrane protein n=1 Tax=Catalinimonas locisalis TaxID=3133978 RepID=UPI003100AA21
MRLNTTKRVSSVKTHLLRSSVLSLMIALFSLTTAWAQNTVSGTVSSAETGEALPGVNVIVKGTTVGTVTDIDGNYRLNVSDDATTLVFSFIGLREQEVAIGDRSTINVEMAEDARQLSEVVVVAYGEQSKRKLTSSIGEIDNTTIESQQLVSVGTALQGTVPGVNIISGSGQPGENPTIRIRGISSINSSSDPLIVLDGSVYNGNLNTIDPNDIASMSVLKDAAAAALYGSRAASGVILINTKRGKAGETRINLRASTGVSSRAVAEYPFITAEQQMLLEWETLYNDANIAGNPNPGQAASDGLLGRIGYNPYGGLDAPIGPDGQVLAGKSLQWATDWEDALLQQGSRQDISLNISGGSEKTQFYFSGSYLKQDGIVINSDFERFNGRINLDTELNDWLKAGLRQSVSTSTQNFPVQSGSSFSSNIQYIRTMASIYPIYRRDVDGSLLLDASGEPIFDDGQNSGLPINVSRPVLQPSNAVAQTTLDQDESERFFSTTSAFLEASFLNNFKARTNFAFNKYFYDQREYTNPEIGSARTVNGRLQRARDITTEWTLTNSLNYNKQFGGGDHSVDVLLLQEAYSFRLNELDVGKTGIPFGGLYQLGSAATLETIDGVQNRERIGSLMARAEYDYKSKYFVQGSIRRDISSRFAPESREGVFYSLSGSWVISDEAFMDDLDFFSFLKFRASYGEVGNSFIQDSDDNQVYFPAENIFQTGFDQLSTPGIYLGPLRNNQITWETSAITNLGLDFGLFRDKVSGSVDAYLKDTRGLIFARPLANSLGVIGGEILENVGNLQNRGIEVSLNWDVINNEELSWSLGGNIAFERNEITSLPQEEIISGSFIRREGNSVYDFYIREWAGVNSATGEPQWYIDSLNTEGDVVGKALTTDINEAVANRINAGTALPWGRGGLNTRLSYKGFDLSALFNFSLGGKILDLDYAGLMEGGLRPGNQKHEDILNRWQNPGDETDVPRLNSSDQGAVSSTRFLFDATYGRLRNVTLGYSLPESVIANTGFLRGLRVYVKGDNLLTFFSREGLDPEQSISGETDNQSSIYRIMSAGIEIDL